MHQLSNATHVHPLTSNNGPHLVPLTTQCSGRHKNANVTKHIFDHLLTTQLRAHQQEQKTTPPGWGWETSPSHIMPAHQQQFGKKTMPAHCLTIPMASP